MKSRVHRDDQFALNQPTKGSVVCAQRLLSGGFGSGPAACVGCRIGAQTFQALQSPATVEGQRASALRFGDARVQCLLAVLLLLCLQLEGFRNRQLRPLLARMIGLEESNIRPGRLSYELRRLRLHGLIKRIEGTHRYRLTPEGLRTVVFYQRTYARIIRPGLSVIPSTSCPQDLPMVRAFHKLQSEIDAYIIQKAA